MNISTINVSLYMRACMEGRKPVNRASKAAESESLLDTVLLLAH